MSGWIPFSVDQATVAVFVAVFFATVVLGFILAPYEMHLEGVRERDALKSDLDQAQSAAAPSLSFAMSLSSPERLPRPLDAARIYRLAIQNTSETRALHNIEVTISFSQPDGSAKTAPRPVKASDGQSAWDLNPGGAKQIDLLATKPDKRPPRVYFAPYGLDLSPRSSHDGTYVVCLEATGRETRKVQSRFMLILSGDGSLQWDEAAP